MKTLKIILSTILFMHNIAFSVTIDDIGNIAKNTQPQYLPLMMEAMVTSKSGLLRNQRFFGDYGIFGPTPDKVDQQKKLMPPAVLNALNAHLTEQRIVIEKYGQKTEEEIIFLLKKKKDYMNHIYENLWKTHDKLSNEIEKKLFGEESQKITHELGRLRNEINVFKPFDDVAYNPISNWLQTLYPSPQFMLLIPNQRNEPINYLFLQEDLSCLNSLIHALIHYQEKDSDEFFVKIASLFKEQLFSVKAVKKKIKGAKEREFFLAESERLARVVEMALREEKKSADPSNPQGQLYQKNITLVSFLAYVLDRLDDATSLYKLSALMNAENQEAVSEKWTKETYERWKRELLNEDGTYNQLQLEQLCSNIPKLTFMCTASELYDRKVPTLSSYFNGIKATEGIAFADCAENSLLNFFMIVFNKDGGIDEDRLNFIAQQIGEKSNSVLFQKFRSFWANIPCVDHIQKREVHFKWADIVSNLNTPDDPLMITYGLENKWEVKGAMFGDGGISSLLNVIAHLIPDDILTLPWASDHTTNKEIALRKFARLCEMLSRENFSLSCEWGFGTVHFLLNGLPLFNWEFHGEHFEIYSAEKPDSCGWKYHLSMESIHTLEPGLRMYFIDRLPQDKLSITDLLHLYHPHNHETWGVSRFTKHILMNNHHAAYPLLRRALTKVYSDADRDWINGDWDCSLKSYGVDTSHNFFIDYGPLIYYNLNSALSRQANTIVLASRFAAEEAEAARVAAEEKEIKALLPRIRALSTHPAYESYAAFVEEIGTGFTSGMNIQEYWDTVWAPVAEEKAARVAAEEAEAAK